MKKFINKHWILCNPLAVMIYANIAIYIIFSLLGWEE